MEHTTQEFMLMTQQEFNDLPLWEYKAVPGETMEEKAEHLPEGEVGYKWKYKQPSKSGDVWWMGEYLPYDKEPGKLCRWIMIVLKAE